MSDEDPQTSTTAAPEPPDADKTIPADEWKARALPHRRGGDFLGTYDAAMRGIAEGPPSLALQQRAILALAASGAHSKARSMLLALKAEGIQDPDITALEARLAKEHALATEGEERTRHALTAATLFECIHARTGGTYSGINAASMWLFAGDGERAAMLARQVLASCGAERPASPEEAYCIAATEAEAALLLRDLDKAEAKLRLVKLLSGDDHASCAALRRHLRRICVERRVLVSVLDLLKPPSILHYTGYPIAPEGFSGRFPAAAEPRVTDQITAYLSARNVGVGYGSLACGADILFAERLLANRSELRVVLPAPVDAFRRAAVEPGGAGWVRRFDLLVKAAASVTVASEDGGECSELLIAHGANMAMGLSLLHARSLDADLEQVAIWDGSPGEGGLSPATSVAIWRARGLRSFCMSPGAAVLGKPSPFELKPAAEGQAICAMLFGELQGYGRLRGPSVPVFIEEVLGALGAVLDAYGDEVLFRDLWGDSLYVVLKGARAAAECALDLQARMEDLPLRTGEPSAGLSLRLGAHLGPVYRGFDPVSKRPSFFGMDIARTARLSPAMPDGEVFVSEPFAAALLLESRAFSCEYVGNIPSAKDLGPMRMYVLKGGGRLAGEAKRPE
ncbi:MAG: adenylate/guanylate cyclase domain-containing protein [Polyangiaceae bacterium]|nr:adenylate/guanylate cyclase domain-containing protein [Polyangiaceae bacterium]